jgi:hypothetical protein
LKNIPFGSISAFATYGYSKKPEQGICPGFWALASVDQDMQIGS